MNHMYCEEGKWYAIIPRGTNQVSSTFRGANKDVFAHPSHRRIVEIPQGLVVKVGDIYDAGKFICRTPEARAIEVGGAAREQRELERLAESSPVDALLKKEGLK